MNVWFIFGVIYFLMVLEWRKYNKIDMGIVDKMVIIVFGIYD